MIPLDMLSGDKILIEFGDILTKIMPESAVICKVRWR